VKYGYKLHRGLHLDWPRGGPFAWLERDFAGIRIFGWQVDLRTSSHHRLFTERQYGCGYKSDLHVHAQRHGEFVGLCFRAIKLRPLKPSIHEPPFTPEKIEALDKWWTDLMRHVRKGSEH
jgi:hypothetical protein